ncbi:acyltransferase [Patescibacteria group bacterium]|nr:acyltransferase [Patescibacteria group bacterium]
MYKEIGWFKAFRFVWFSCIQTVLHWSLPPARVILLRWLGASIGKDCVILNCFFYNAYHYGFSKLKIGNKCFIGDEVMIDLRGRTVLEDYVTLSNRVTLVTHLNVGYKDHPLQKRYPTRESHILFKRGCFIGTGAIILPGITVGRESVVGAGAVVTKNIPDGQLVVGVPARVKK